MVPLRSIKCCITGESADLRKTVSLGISPSKPQHFWIQRSNKALTDLHRQAPVLPFKMGLPVLASAGGAQSRCTRTDSAEQAVLHRAVSERSTERFSVRITALSLTTFECGRRAHLASDQGTGAQGDVII